MFKEMMLAFKQEVVGGGLGFEVQVGMCAACSVSARCTRKHVCARCIQRLTTTAVVPAQVRRLQVHTEEQEEGDARPDLDQCGLCISPISHRPKQVAA